MENLNEYTLNTTLELKDEIEIVNYLKDLVEKSNINLDLKSIVISPLTLMDSVVYTFDDENYKKEPKPLSGVIIELKFPGDKRISIVIYTIGEEEKKTVNEDDKDNVETREAIVFKSSVLIIDHPDTNTSDELSSLSEFLDKKFQETNYEIVDLVYGYLLKEIYSLFEIVKNKIEKKIDKEVKQ